MEIGFKVKKKYESKSSLENLNFTYKHQIALLIQMRFNKIYSPTVHGLPFIWKIDAINRSLDSHAYLDFITKWKRIAKFSFETCEMMRSQCYKQGGRKQVRYGTKLYIQSAIKICRYSDCSHFRWACVFALCLRQPKSNFNLRPKLSLVLKVVFPYLIIS